MKQPWFPRSVTLISILLALQACGGGGGGSSAPAPAPAPPPPANVAPTAAFSTTPTSGNAPLTVTVDATASSDSDGEIVQYNWMFDDDNSDAVGEVAEHTFTDPGSYTITLTIEDDDGDQATAEQQITVEEALGDTFTLSGTIQVLSSSAIDSDVNDVLTTATSNNTFAEAQALTNPATLGGYANTPGEGENGNLRASGDPGDFYRVTLTGNETILLTIGDGSADLDLRLWDGSENLVDESLGVAQTESLQVSQPGVYFIEVFPFDGASNYILNVGEAAEISAVPQQSPRLSDEFVPGDIILDQQIAPIVVEDALRVRGGERGAPRLVQLRMDNPTDMLRPAHGHLTDVQLAKHHTLMRLKQLQRDPRVECAEVNMWRRPFLTPDDQYFNLQWHYSNINLPLAWDVTTGSTDVIVAVVDSGVLLNHPDLNDNLVGGYDFISSAATARDGDGIDDNPNDDGDLAYGGSSSFHGTHVAGTIAAETNNGSGVAGVAWNTRIMPLRALGVDGGSSYDVMQAIRYAAGLSNDSGTVPTQRADIINLSLGGSFSSQSEQNTLTEVRNQGVIVIAAAGNESTTTPQYPASYDGVVSVSATTITNDLAPYSNQGATVDVAAPGGNGATDLNGDGVGDGVISTMGDDGNPGPIQFGYAALNGTSMAAPHVAGVAALMKAVHAGLTPQEFDTALQNGDLTDDLGAAGRDDTFGHGLINAQKAVAAATALAAGQGTDPGPILSASLSTLNFGPFSSELPLTLSNIGTGAISVGTLTPSEPWLTIAADNTDANGLGAYTVTIDRTGLADGTYRATIDVTSDANNISIVVLMQVTSINTAANAGTHYVIVVNDNNESILPAVVIEPQDGAYPFTVEGVPAGQYRIFAGTDSDNDNFLCDAGEACGAFATLDTPERLNVNDDRADLNFLSEFRVNIGGAAAGSSTNTTNAEHSSGISFRRENR